MSSTFKPEGTAETLDEALKMLKALGLFSAHEWISFACMNDGVAQFRKTLYHEGANGYLELEISFGTNDPEDNSGQMTFNRNELVTKKFCTPASKIVVWEPGHSGKPFIINYINRAF